MEILVKKVNTHGNREILALAACLALFAHCKKSASEDPTQETKPEAPQQSVAEVKTSEVNVSEAKVSGDCPDRPKSDALRRLAVGSTPPLARLRGTLRGCSFDFEGSGLAEMQHPEPLPERLVLIKEGVIAAHCEGPDPTVALEVVSAKSVAIARTFGETRRQFLPADIATIHAAQGNGETHIGLRIVAVDECGYALDTGTGFDTLHARWKMDAECDTFLQSDPRGLAVDGFSRDWDKVSLKKLGAGTCQIQVSSPTGDASIRIQVE